MRTEERLRRDAETRQRNRSNGLRQRVFTVVGPRRVNGKTRGEEVTLELTDAQADALILAGHVEERSATVVVPVADDAYAADFRGNPPSLRKRRKRHSDKS